MRSPISILACCLLPCAAAYAQVQAGPGAWSPSQTWAPDSAHGGNLTGYYYWPSGQPALGGKRALVIVLHGCAQTAAGDVIDAATDGGFNWKRAAEQYGAVIVAPNATGNVYGSHCWDYTSASHTRTSGHDGVLLDVVNRFVNNTQFAIDPQQVYVTGLSSGGGQTMVLGCLAPDVFAGVGINAGPPPGTSTTQIGTVPSGYTASTAANKCRTLAGSYSAGFTTQIASVIWGTNDYTVAQAYGPMDAAAMRLVYGGTFTKGAAVAVAPGGSNLAHTDASGRMRTSEMTVTGQGHAWPAGAGGQAGNYVDASKVNYPAFVMDFWFRNNLRVSRVAAPVMTACKATVSGNAATITGAATDAAGPVSSYRVVLNGATAVNDPAAGSGASFSIGYALANGYYTGSVSATNAATGLTSTPCAIPQFLVGPAPVLPPPAGLGVTARTGTSISLAWSAVNGAGGYHVYRDGSRITSAALTGTSFTATGLAPATSYRFQVSSSGAAGESALSAPLQASTTDGFVCTATSASNYQHVQSGRAIASGGYALAKGSGQNMGLNNTFYTTVLAQTAPAYYVIGNCPAP